MTRKIPYWLQGGLFGVLLYSLPFIVVDALASRGDMTLAFLYPLSRFGYVIFEIVALSFAVPMSLTAEICFMTCFGFGFGALVRALYVRRHRFSHEVQSGFMGFFFLVILLFGYLQKAWLRFFPFQGTYADGNGFIVSSLIIQVLVLSVLAFGVGYVIGKFSKKPAQRQ